MKRYFVLTALVVGFLLSSVNMALAAQQPMKVLQPKYNFEFYVYPGFPGNS